MSSAIEDNLMPVGKLGIIPLQGCSEIATRADGYIKEWRGSGQSFLVNICCPRFGTGESKGMINQSVRGDDLFILCDIFDYGTTYNMYGIDNRMSPDDHYGDLKRIIAAAGGKARRINVIMPMLYGGRQHRRTARESLDCAIMLQELQNIGVVNIITFDAHDSRVQNAVPFCGFENIKPYYQMIKAIYRAVPDVKLDKDHTLIVSPDAGSIDRCMYYSSILSLDLGIYYKRRDYSRIENGRNPIIAHEYLGNNVTGKDIVIVDDMISSGDSILDITRHLKEMGAQRIFIFATFGLFCEGLSRFDEAFAAKQITKVFTTNLNYRTDELKSRCWYEEVDMSKYIALLIDTLNYDKSLSDLIDPAARIKKLLSEKRGCFSKVPHEIKQINS